MFLRPLALVLAVVSLAVATPLTVDPINESVVALATSDGQIYCTGFVIDAKRRFVMTADHCMKFGAPIINGEPAVEIFHVPQLDVAVLDAAGVKQPALKPNLDIQPFDTPIVAYGYANGLPTITMIAATILMPRVNFEGFPGYWYFFTPSPVMGMSGGPIVGVDGRVVAVVQQGNADAKFGISRGMTDIYEATKAFWEAQ